MQKPAIPRKDATASERSDVPFGSNEVRLAPGEWIIAGIVLAALFYCIPILWERIEPLDGGADYRIPYPLGHDYWTYNHYCGEACRQRKTLVIGDSVIWGHYVGKDETLSHYLNELRGQEQFLNLGVDGIHPAALEGLIRHYGRDISDEDVLLHCNLLWMSSKRHDLQTTKEFAFHHPTLVPQFFPRIPCYRASLKERIGIVSGRNVAFPGWTEHLQYVYFGRSCQLGVDDIQDWPGFCRKLKHEGAATAPSAGRRIWQLMPPRLRTAVEQATQEERVDEVCQSDLVKALNEMVKRRDFYREEDFREADLPVEARSILQLDSEVISAAKVQRLNRLLLEASYPNEVGNVRFQRTEIPQWTIDHPYENPITLELPSPDEPPSPPPDATPWTEKEGIAKFNAPWVELETSFQWDCLKRTIGILQRRGNRVFVLVGPFNEHMLTEESLDVYRKRKREVEAWLQENAIPYAIPPALPSECYADASHPLREGYRMLAEQFCENESFVRRGQR